MPNISIQFVLTLQNNGPEEVQILDRLEKFSQQLITSTKKLIPLPRRVPKDLPMVALPRAHLTGKTATRLIPPPSSFARLRLIPALVTKKGNRKNPPGGRVQIAFDSERVITENLIEALRNEVGENAKSFRARALVDLLNASPQPGVGGRLPTSSWLVLKVPSS